MMKKRIAALFTAGALALSMLTGCGGAKKESWKVTCPWAPSGVAAMVSQKAAAKSPEYSDSITLVAEAIKGDAATVNTWVSSTKANDTELVFAGEGLVKGIIAACLGLLISCVGADPMTSYDRFTFGIPRLYLGLDLAVTLIGLFALVEIIGKAELKRNELNLRAGTIGKDDGKITKEEYKRMIRPAVMGSIIGSCVGIVPGTGASEASWFSYNTAKNMSKHPEEFSHGSVEAVAAAESANNAVCGATLIPLLTLGIPSVNSSYFDLSVALVFGVMAWFMRKLELPAVPVLLGMVLGNMTETNFRRALLISDGSPKIFFSSVYCWIFIVLIVVAILGILRGKIKEAKAAQPTQNT